MSANRVDSFLKAPPDGVRVVLVYGPDEGLVRERAEALGKTVVEDLSDPFLVTELEGAALNNDPARLADEVSAIAMTGGRRLIRVRECADSIAPIVESVLNETPGDALTILMAGPLNPRSPLRKLAEKAKDAAALPCYVDDARSLDQVIRESLAEDGVEVSADAAGWLADRLGADRGVTRSELAKLALFVGSGGRVEIDDAMACVGDSADRSVDDLVFAAADGDAENIDRILTRCFQEGASPVGVLRAMTGHLMRLRTVVGRVSTGADIDTGMKALRPPVFFKYAGRFRGQARLWTPAALARALQLTLEAEVQCKSTGMPDSSICGRGLLQSASLARRGRRAR